MAPPRSNTLQANFNVDYVISYRFTDVGMKLITYSSQHATHYHLGKADAQASFERLIEALARISLATEVRSGENQSVLVFVKPASANRFNNAVYRSR